MFSCFIVSYLISCITIIPAWQLTLFLVAQHQSVLSDLIAPRTAWLLLLIALTVVEKRPLLVCEADLTDSQVFTDLPIDHTDQQERQALSKQRGLTTTSSTSTDNTLLQPLDGQDGLKSLLTPSVRHQRRWPSLYQ